MSNTEKNEAVDRIDRAILGELKRDARVSFRDLGTRVNLSANAVAERVRRLVATGVIRGFHARVNPAALGHQMSVYVDIKTGSNASVEDVRKLLARIPEVHRAVWTTGQFDFTIEISCEDQADLVRIIDILRSKTTIRETYTRVICMDMSDEDGTLPNIKPGTQTRERLQS
jgi:Lrp/AsnC family leucine-responsive transcriptional regulator